MVILPSPPSLKICNLAFDNSPAHRTSGHQPKKTTIYLNSPPQPVIAPKNVWRLCIPIPATAS